MDREAVNAVAIVTVRNEALHIRRCLRDLIAGGLDVILVDNDSTDGSADIAREFLGNGLISIEQMPYHGVFSLSQQLSFKKELAAAAAHEWILHVDADEWLQAPNEYPRLIDGIRAADLLGYNCINFLEFVFVPRPGANYEIEDYASLMRDYYFFNPCHPWLIRAWKRIPEFDNCTWAGHLVTGPNVHLLPQDFILRHYIVLSDAHARRKYLGREFPSEELAKNWHVDRVIINAENISLRTGPPLLTLEDPRSSVLSTACPTALHFWQWPPAATLDDSATLPDPTAPTP